MSRLLLALQYCSKDAGEAFHLARCVGKFQRDDPGLGLLFWHDQDAPAPPSDLLAELSGSCEVFTAKAPECAAGWPEGPNEMWQWLVHHLRDPSFCPGYEHVLTTEPDSVPLHVGWDRQVYNWHEQAVRRGKWFTGHICTAPRRHMNGNMVVKRDVAARFPDLLRRLPRGKAWDMEFSEITLGHGEDNPFVMSDYKCQRKDSVALWNHDKGLGQCGWLHGVKGWHGLDEWERRFGGVEPEAIPRILHQVVLDGRSTACADTVRAAHPHVDGWEYHRHGQDLLAAHAKDPVVAGTDKKDLDRLEDRLGLLELARTGGWYVASQIRLNLPLGAMSIALPGATFLASRRGEGPCLSLLGSIPRHDALHQLVLSTAQGRLLDTARGITWMPEGWRDLLDGSGERRIEAAASEIPRFVCVAKDVDGSWVPIGAAMQRQLLFSVQRHHQEVHNQPAVIVRVVRT